MIQDSPLKNIRMGPSWLFLLDPPLKPENLMEVRRAVLTHSQSLGMSMTPLQRLGGGDSSVQVFRIGGQPRKWGTWEP